MEKNLPKNDSRFRLDIRFLEIGDDINKAQLYKEAYEQKQRTEILDEGHKILFFYENVDSETDSCYFTPNGKYWEMKKNGTLKNNQNSTIFQVDNYVKEILEKNKDKIKDKDDGEKSVKIELKKKEKPKGENNNKIEEDKKEDNKTKSDEKKKKEKDKKNTEKEKLFDF